MELSIDSGFKTIGEMLISKNETIAVAESVTSGLLQYALGSLENASQFYQGGMTAYNIGQKYRHLAVEPIHALKVNCVSEAVAKQMALEVSNQFHSHWGIGVTGYASPVPESGNKIFCYFAIAFEQKITRFSKISTESSTPSEAQVFYISTILNSLKELLQGS